MKTEALLERYKRAKFMFEYNIDLFDKHLKAGEMDLMSFAAAAAASGRCDVFALILNDITLQLEAGEMTLQLEERCK